MNPDEAGAMRRAIVLVLAMCGGTAVALAVYLAGPALAHGKPPARPCVCGPAVEPRVAPSSTSGSRASTEADRLDYLVDSAPIESVHRG